MRYFMYDFFFTEFETDDKLEYNFFPNSSEFCQFRVRANNDAHLCLTTGACESEPMYEIFIGGWGNSKSVIRKNRTKPDVAEIPTPGILNGGEFRGFWIRWNNGTIAIGREREAEPFLSWTDSEYVPIAYVGICTGWGSTGSWIIDRAGAPSAPFTSGGQGGGYAGAHCWVAADSGQIPPRAFPGGEDNGEPMYIARCQFKGGLLPGKLLSSHGCCYIPWGGAENPSPQYEVLCDFNGTWTACHGGAVPPNAVTAGQSEDGEPLYVGRVSHEGTLTIGKVQPSHNTCYIPYGGQELGFQEFEILVS